MNRNPPTTVLEQLRREQKFVCAVPDCHSPYLFFHHFDPKWRERHHHDADGMVGLCGEHHPKADAGAYTVEQLREFKTNAKSRGGGVSGSFDWLRRDLVLVAGGICFIEAEIAVEVAGRPAVWFRRDNEGYALLNVRMPQSSPSRRVAITDNFWITTGNVDSLVCPPGGKRLKVGYRNGDQLSVSFAEIDDAQELKRRHPSVSGVILHYQRRLSRSRSRFPAWVSSLILAGSARTQSRTA